MKTALAHRGRRWQRWAAYGLSLTIAGLGTLAWLSAAKASHSSVTEIHAHSYAVQPDDLDLVASRSTYVVEGRVREVLPSFWTTPDGKAPADLRQMAETLDVQLRTPVVMTVERVLKGPDHPRAMAFTVYGGTDQGLTLTSDQSPHYQVGSRIVVFLSRAPANAGRWSRVSAYYPQLTFVEEGNLLRGPLSDVSRTQFPLEFDQEGVDR